MKYLISFPGPALNVPVADMPAVADAAQAVIREAKRAGVCVFGGGINEAVKPVGREDRESPPLFPGASRVHVRHGKSSPGS